MKERKTKAISALSALGHRTKLLEPRIINNWVIWLEQRPHERGRTTALIRPWGRPDIEPLELTPNPINLRTRVHIYGGCPLTAAYEKNQLHICWIDDSDGCLWSQCWRGIHNLKAEKNFLFPSEGPLRLSRNGLDPLADGLIDLSRDRWIGVMEIGNQDLFVTFSLKDTNQTPQILYEADDFAGYAVLGPDSNQLAWVEWQQPFMPWDSSQLWWGEFDHEGQLKSKNFVAGNDAHNKKQTSVFQPLWSPSGQLTVTEDSTGWWNLMVTRSSIKADIKPVWLRNWPMSAETAMPQWVYGMKTTSWAEQDLITCMCKEGTWSISLLSSDGRVKEIDQPYDDLSSLDAQGKKVVAIASNSTTGSGLLELNLESGEWDHTPATKLDLLQSEISKPESFWFQGYGGNATQAWYYPPTCSLQTIPPLLVKSHSGPTGMASTGLNPSIQFWTSRGWGVVDVNYGGSTGFGRNYRDRLLKRWGEVDVTDCTAAAQSLIDIGKADKERIAIEGSSAGGFTTLACLCFTDVFNVGACHYAVSDLSSLVKETHRFEARYLDGLIGPWPEKENIYQDRSPLFNAEKINCPVIFFQGLKDKVVPTDQTDKIVNELRKNKIPVEIHLFKNEGHGFRDSKVKVKVLEETERFFRKYLNL